MSELCICTSCGLPFVDHKGVIGTCRELQAYKASHARLLAALEASAEDLQQYRKAFYEQKVVDKLFLRTGKTPGQLPYPMIYSERQIKSIRKARKCIWCSEQLLEGQPAVDVFCKMEGMDVTSGAMHPECFTGGWEKEDWDCCDYLFSQGDYHRGCCCGRGKCECEINQLMNQ